MALNKDWKDRPFGPDPGETPRQYEDRLDAYAVANPGVMTPLSAAAMEDVETRAQAELDAKVATTDTRLTNARTPTAHTHPQADVTNLGTDLAAKAAVLGTPNTYTANQTLALVDGGKVVEINTAAAAVVTVPTDAAVAFAVGTQIVVRQLGAGQVSVAGGTLSSSEKLSNPGFEADALGAAPAGWGNYSVTASSTTTSFVVVDTWAAQGTKSLRFAGTKVTDATTAYPNIRPKAADGDVYFPAVAGATYTANATVNVAVNSGNSVFLAVQFYDVNKALLASPSNAEATALGVTALSKSGVAPAGTAFVRYQLNQALSDGQTWDWRVDACSLSAPGTVPVRARGGALKLAAQYAEAALTKRSTDEWVLSGDVIV